MTFSMQTYYKCVCAYTKNKKWIIVAIGKPRYSKILSSNCLSDQFGSNIKQYTNLLYVEEEK